MKCADVSLESCPCSGILGHCLFDRVEPSCFPDALLVDINCIMYLQSEFSFLEPERNQQSQTKDSTVTTRKAVRRPMPKLDAQR